MILQILEEDTYPIEVIFHPHPLTDEWDGWDITDFGWYTEEVEGEIPTEISFENLYGEGEVSFFPVSHCVCKKRTKELTTEEYF